MVLMETGLAIGKANASTSVLSLQHHPFTWGEIVLLEFNSLPWTQSLVHSSFQLLLILGYSVLSWESPNTLPRVS